MFCDNCGCHLGEIIGLFCEECGASLFPRNLTETELLSQNNNEQEIIEKYFNDGYDYNIINTMVGYGGMWNLLRVSYGIRTSRNVVLRMLKELDPVATEERRSRQLKRRRYKSCGTNDAWHVGGYDKLKPYELPIHGTVDGFSWKTLWLKVCKSNNNPINPACFFC